MTDQLDSFYDCVNARSYGSLGNDDDVTEVMCNAFFEAHKNDSSITVSLHDALVSSQTSSSQNSQSYATATSELPSGMNGTENPETERTLEEPKGLGTENPQTERAREGPKTLGTENPQTERTREELVVIQRTEEGQQSQEVHKHIQDENMPEIATVPKTAEELENLGRLAMFGKQRAVLRRSQIREPPATSAPSNEADNRSTLRVIPRRATTPTPTEHPNPNGQQTDTATGVKNERSSRPCPGRVTPRVTPRVTTLAQRRTPLEPSARPRTAAPVAVNRTPVLKAVRTNVVAQSPAGPVTRARSRELGSRIGSANTVQANAAPRIQRSGTENIENGLRQMRLGGERISRNRAPRTTTSSRSSGLSHLQPVRIQQPRNPDSFLRDEAIPTPYEFRQELLHRNASLGSSERSSSTPKDNVKTTANGAGTTSKAPTPSTTRPTTNPSQRPTIRSSSATRPVSVANRPVPRASSVTRIPTSTSASAVRPTARSSSVTRPGVRPPSVTRPYTSSAATRPQGQPAASATRPQLQPTASATERRRPPSVSRPQVRPPSVTRPHIPTTATKRHDIPRGGALSSAARVPAGRGPVTIQGSARRTNTVRATPTQQRPTEPRSSVIRNPPSNKGPGDGTPVREFRTELRRYPAPTGLTPIHRHVTTTASVNFHPMHDHACTSKQNHANPITANAPTPTKVLSKQEVTAMINRLSMPRKTTIVATPLKIASEETHGLSCIKTRSRSSSMARRPLSAQDQMRPTTSRALDFAPEDHPRPASADQLEENVTLQEPSNETAP